MSKSSRSKAKILSSREVFRGPIFWVTSEQVQEPTGVTARRDVVRHPGSVVILPVEQRGGEPHVLIERQYRHTVGDYLWELPAGRIDEGESEMAAAKRELLEETGYRARRWQRILKYYASPGFVAEPMSLYLATGLRPGDARPEADEVIRFRLFPLPDAVRMVMRGTIRDAKTIAGVLWLAQQDTGRKPRR
jgi:ADP-ribose pyrophosphatase